jgi:hypothetical protein
MASPVAKPVVEDDGESLFCSARPPHFGERLLQRVEFGVREVEGGKVSGMVVVAKLDQDFIRRWHWSVPFCRREVP